MTNEANPWVIDADEQTFQRDAVERSRAVLVVVDFWAAWCQPCRLLSPLLEQLAREHAGQFLLVKVETEKAPGIAAGFGVQSIPAVYALRDGRLVDYFVGLLSEPELRGWLDRLLPTAAETLVTEGRKLAGVDPAGAEAKFREAAALDANLASARIALAELLLDTGRADECRQVIDELERRGFLEDEAEKLKARLHMAQQALKAGDVDALRAAAAAEPRNWQTRLELAAALAAGGQHQGALEEALAVVAAHDKAFVEPARQFMVDLFRVLGDDNELVTEYRRKLSTALY